MASDLHVTITWPGSGVRVMTKRFMVINHGDGRHSYMVIRSGIDHVLSHYILSYIHSFPDITGWVALYQCIIIHLLSSCDSCPTRRNNILLLSSDLWLLSYGKHRMFLKFFGSYLWDWNLSASLSRHDFSTERIMCEVLSILGQNTHISFYSMSI